MNKKRRFQWLRNVLIGVGLIVCCCVTFAEMEWASPKGIGRFSYTPSPITSLKALSTDGWVAEDLNVAGETFRSIRRERANNKWVLFLPGNGEAQLQSAKLGFAEFEDVSVMAVAYPGFDSAPGAPSKESVFRAGELALDWIRKHHPDAELHVVGFSLGSCVAMHLAGSEKIDSLSILGTFTPIDVILGNRRFLKRWAPADRYDTYELAKTAASNTCPVQFIHGAKDQVVTVEGAETVAKIFDQTVKRVPAGHGDLLHHKDTQALLKQSFSP